MTARETVPIVSRACPDGTLLETLYDPAAGTTALAVADPSGAVDTVPHFDLPDSTRLVPYSPSNNLLATGCVLLPSALGEVGDVGDIVRDIRAYLDRYVMLSPGFLGLAPYYVLLSWAYDRFREVPALRFRGDWGSGKTRALLALGSLCYKPFFASGASTVSPIFHILDTFRGTLVLDEADYRFSDMTGELVKILNNGTVDGLPVLRTMTNRHRELNPQAFRVFGPKLIAMRERFDDPALESRLITEEMARGALPAHIPIHTPDSLHEEARELRNRLLAWRMRSYHAIAPDGSRVIAGADARTSQMAVALLSLIDDPEERSRISAWLASGGSRRREAERTAPEAMAVVALVGAFAEATGPAVRLSDVAARFNAITSERSHLPLSNKAVGHILRAKLGISTAKVHGAYAITQGERERIRELADRYDVPHTFSP